MRATEAAGFGEVLRIWVDDPHPIFRRGLVASLKGGGFRIAGESERLRPMPDPLHTDVLVFDAGESALLDVVSLVDSVALVALVRHPTAERLCEIVEAGVGAVLLQRELTPPVLEHAVRAAANGTSTLPSTLVPTLLERAATGSRCHRNGSLTDRELKVLDLLAGGDDTREIAESLCYSERTVKNVVHDILVKMNCRNRAHAVALATRRGMI